MQWSGTCIVLSCHIGAVLQKLSNNIHVTIFRRPLQRAPVFLVPDCRIRAPFKEDPSSFSMAESTCNSQRSLAPVEALSVYALRMLIDEGLDDAV